MLWTIILLICSNVFMTFAWYGHLKWFGPDQPGQPGQRHGLFLIILLSWGLAFFEYCFQVPANRIGRDHAISTAQLKTIQEVISLSVFAVFMVTFMGEKLGWNHLVGFALIVLGAGFIFKPWGA